MQPVKNGSLSDYKNKRVLILIYTYVSNAHAMGATTTDSLGMVRTTVLASDGDWGWYFPEHSGLDCQLEGDHYSCQPSIAIVCVKHIGF